MSKYEITFEDGSKEIVETKRTGITGIFGYHNDSYEGWGISMTTAKNPAKAFETFRNSKRMAKWLCDFHMAEFKEI